MQKKIFLIVLGGFLLSPVVLGAASDLTQLNVYPNPVRPYQGFTQVTFNNLTNPCRIRIYDVDGSLVRDVLTDGSNAYVWDLKNDSGQNAASGIYIYLITNDAGEKKTGKIAIIR